MGSLNSVLFGIVAALAFMLIVTTWSQNILADEAGDAAINNQTETFLSIQAAQSGSLSELNATTYPLELNDVSDR